MEKITADDSLALSWSCAVDPAIMRYQDGSVEVRSSLPGGSDDMDEPVTVIDRDGLSDLIPDPSDWVDGEPTRKAAEAAAESLNAG